MVETSILAISDKGANVKRVPRIVDRSRAGRRTDGLFGFDPDPADAAESVADETRTYEIHTLGPSGSGKTVFTASLYHRMLIRRPEYSFYLKSDPTSSAYLNGVYNQIADTDEDWPIASQDVREWNFTTCLQSAAGDFEPLRFRFLDYPGGVLTNPRAAQDATVSGLVDRLRSANALFVLLDGQAMLALLQNEELGTRYLAFDIISSLEIAQQSRCPVQFVVTKWDLLDGHYSLEQLRQRLMLNENFRDLVRSKAEDTPATIRLFPVSSVGPGFAALTEYGEMRKSGRPLQPHNVELPLLAVLPDFLQFAYSEIQAREALLGDRGEPTGRAPKVSRQWQPLMQGMTETGIPWLRKAILARYPLLAPILPENLFRDVAKYAESLAQGQAARVRMGRQRYADDLMRRRQGITDELSALQLIQMQCEDRISGYEEAHPTSVLAGGTRRFSPEAVGRNGYAGP